MNIGDMIWFFNQYPFDQVPGNSQAPQFRNK